MRRIIRWFYIRPVKTMVVSLFVSLLGYGCLFHFKLAVMIMLILLVHELGHVIAARVCGLGMAVPLFLPFIGAVVRLRRLPSNAKITAEVAMGGPALGCLGALVSMIIYYWTQLPELLELAYFSSWFNLLNLLPTEPLDGGKIVRGIAGWLWRLGLCSCLAAALYFRSWLLLGIVTMTGINQLLSRERIEPDAGWQRSRVLLGSYVLLVTVLAIMALWLAESVN